jgi:hypothetical protein
MDALIRSVRRQAYNCHYENPELIEPIFQLFLAEPDRAYAIQLVSRKTGVPLTTLYSWRERVRADREWRPSKDHFSTNRRILPDEIEELIARFVRINFAWVGRLFDRPVLRPLLLILVQDFVAEGVLPPSALNFKCSYHFMSRFLNRAGLSSWKARTARRPEIDDGECAEFLAKMAAAYERHPTDHMINFDESSRP